MNPAESGHCQGKTASGTNTNRPQGCGPVILNARKRKSFEFKDHNPNRHDRLWARRPRLAHAMAQVQFVAFEVPVYDCRKHGMTPATEFTMRIGATRFLSVCRFTFYVDKCDEVSDLPE
jgi:hypothetical protein